jgi:tetratricopeptide (TPR) repeat protein
MLRMLRAAQIPLIILMLVAVVLAPAPVKGYWDLRQAEAESVARAFWPAGRDYEAAARVLLWRPDLWERAAIAYASAGDWQRAMPLFERAQALDALSADGWDAFGTGYWLQAEDAKALEAWDAGLHRFPQQAKFYSRFALAYRNIGQFDAERQALETWLAGGRGTAAEHYRLGQLMMASDAARAQTELVQASAMDKTFGPAVATLQAALTAAAEQADESQRMVLIGRGLGLVQEWRLAGAAFEAGTRANPQNAEAWAWLGEARQQAGQDGLPELDRALSLDPADTLVHGLRGLYWKRQGQFSKAVAEYQAAVQAEPGSADWQAALGEAYALNGDLVSALASYRKATELAPTKATYWRLLAAFCADNGTQLLNVGLPAAEKAAALAPNDPQVLDTQGWSYSQAGLLYKAEQALTSAVKLAPDMALAHLHLGENYLRQGNGSSARDELRAAGRLDPEGPVGALAGKLLQQYFP